MKVTDSAPNTQIHTDTDSARLSSQLQNCTKKPDVTEVGKGFFFSSSSFFNLQTERAFFRLL